MTTTAQPAWTTRTLLAWMGQAFERAELDAPRFSAEMLMAHVLGCERLRLYMDPDRPASPLERESLRDLVRRALEHEPIQYLTGQAWFCGHAFAVDARVLIPRPSSRTIVDHVIRHMRAEPGSGGREGSGVLIADVCTGSGNIAISILKALPGARAIATDLSADALAVAATNAETLGVADRIDLLEGDLLEPILAHPAGTVGGLHYLVSNPPYIPDGEWEAVEANVKDHEPTEALRGGVDGLNFVRPLIEFGPRLVRPHGLILIEVASARADTALELMRANELIDETAVLCDEDALPRVVVGHRAG